jgi:hypothetical protein
MELTDKIKEAINQLSYEDLLRSYRFAPAGDTRFQGESGEYWIKRMNELRDAGADHAAASKAVGWEGENR